MTYKILKLVSDYVLGTGTYINRIELGDAGLGGPVDIRFIQYPGWIENTHSVFFGVDVGHLFWPQASNIRASLKGDRWSS